MRTRERGPPSASAEIGPSDDDQAVSLSDDGTTIIIDFFSSFSLFSFFLSTAITVLPERVVVGFPNFAWAPKKK